MSAPARLMRGAVCERIARERGSILSDRAGGPAVLVRVTDLRAGEHGKIYADLARLASATAGGHRQHRTVPATASAMLAADPVVSGVYYIDDHFVPYAGAKPAGKGWNNKRGRAEKGRAGTHVTAHDGAGGVLRDREAAASPRNGADSHGAAHARQAR